jgi:hypothetical protein
MFTQTHLLLGAAVYARPGNCAVAIAGLVGALVPDTDVWLMFIIERLNGSSGCEVFHYRYWEPPWTTFQMALNSIPAYLALIATGLACIVFPGSKLRAFAIVLLAFASSALLHVCIDFLLHHDDARAQWMPFSGWVFRSPVSYWDPSYYGSAFVPFEIGLGLALVALVGRRFGDKRLWVILAILPLGYVGSIAAGQMSGADHLRGPGSCEILADREV